MSYSKSYLEFYINRLFEEAKVSGDFEFHEGKRALSVSGILWIGWHFDNINLSNYPAVSVSGFRLDKVVDEGVIAYICHKAKEVFGLEW